MGELEKILIMINRWGYLNLEQIALLLNKNIKTIQLQKEKLINLKNVECWHITEEKLLYFNQ
ncbi:hypothetical protein SRED_003048 (plasmid) [Spiroplasma melliferum]|uniref:Uncharacterized protein n=1 Tax=Spiroplasma melliferum TaxID=2134 RepID=A0ABX5U7X2_SPIME|nr:hypothetical protein [Spiroplasma melliferum]QCO23186.1 hypothetical protein SRED_003048 [Spiroplasma melliferum]